MLYIWKSSNPIKLSFKLGSIGSKRQKTKGFTLVELLIVASILGVISLTIYSTFNNGLKIWQKVNKPLAEEDLGIFFDRWTGELRNCIKFSSLPFNGNKYEFEFPALVNSRRLNNKTVGKISYSYDQQAKAIFRKQQDFSQLYSNEEGAPQQLLSNVESFEFSYYFYDKQKKAYLWQEDCQSGTVPLAVKIALTITNDAKTNPFIKTVSIPISG